MLEQDSPALFARAGPAPSPVGSAELAQGLLLMRASAMKVVRLQLAMERRDRAVALRTMDDLVALDSSIRDFLNEMPGAGEGLEAAQRELDAERTELDREKFGLAAGMIRRGRDAPRPWQDEIDPAGDMPADPVGAVAEAAGALPEPASEFQIEDCVAEWLDEPESPRRWPWLLLAFTVLLVAASVALLLVEPRLAERPFDPEIWRSML